MTVVKIKNKSHKKGCHKKTIKFKNYKNCLEATQLQNKVNYLEKNKIDIDSLNSILKNP